MASRFEQNVYLPRLPDPQLPALHSPGAKRRAAQLQRFLTDLLGPLKDHLEVAGEGQLVVLKRRDWQQLFRYPYGLPFTRTRAGQVSVVVAADYPPKLLRRFDEMRLRAVQAGQPPAGEVGAFLDLLIGHELGHLVANLSSLRTRVKWLDELMASHLYVLALRELGYEDVLERFLSWARAQVAGSRIERVDLGAFEYPRARLQFDNLLWFQGVFTLRAAELAEARAWRFVEAFQEALPLEDRGEVARALIRLEPGFVDWFKVFADREKR